MTGDIAKIAVVGSGISGLAAAWLLDQQHDVTLFEADRRPGGHTRTIDVEMERGRIVPVDTGFIVYNEQTYPNLTAMFDHLGVATRASDMSFAVSLDGGKLEYAAREGLKGLFAQRRNLISPRFWSMLRDLVRFYREAPAHAGKLGLATLGDFLAEHGYGPAFRDDHLLPMAAAIWSAPAPAILDYPAESFIRFCENHGLLKLANRPRWRTVVGGSRSYIDRMLGGFGGRVCLGRPVARIERGAKGVIIVDGDGVTEAFDHVVIATHADQALAMLADPSEREGALLSAFRYSRNAAILHDDPALMPRRRSTWASWNYLGHRDGERTGNLCVSYWMNRLQGIPDERPLIVTLNPNRSPNPGSVIDSVMFDHPLFDNHALAAQRQLWSLQGARNTWFCGAHFGAGFHEDGLQSGLAVAEALGVERPWTVAHPSGRIFLSEPDLDIAA
jgi:predicted NAD/FAD-binding protein